MGAFLSYAQIYPSDPKSKKGDASVGVVDVSPEWGFDLQDYIECINFCKRLDNSEQIKTCMEGCRYVDKDRSKSISIDSANVSGRAPSAECIKFCNKIGNAGQRKECLEGCKYVVQKQPSNNGKRESKKGKQKRGN